MNNNRKKILYFMPDNPLKRDAGNKMRAFKILEYFASRGEVELDFVSERRWGMWTEDDISEFRAYFPTIGLHVFDRKRSKANLLTYFLAYKLPNYIRKHKFLLFAPPIPDLNTVLLQRNFDELLRNNKYDYIIISYVTWATLVQNNPLVGDARLIIDTHDFITSQNKKRKSFRLGSAFEEEMRRLSIFDEIWSLSVEENYLFRQFVKADHRFMPLMHDKPIPSSGAEENEKVYDVIYVASDNEHNILSARWFFSNVYPLLPTNLSFCVIGRIGKYIAEDLPNVYKFSFVDDTTPYYKKSKLAICPMFDGTGIKVKIVEALSHGIPVVSTPDGMVGLPDKSNNGCMVGNNAEEFAAHILLLSAESGTNRLYCEQAESMFDRHFETQKGYQIMDLAMGGFDIKEPVVA